MYMRHSQVNEIGALNYPRHRIIYLALEDEEFVKMFALFELFEPFHVFSRGEESRDVQVDGVGLGFARGAEKTPIVTKVPPELARSLEISLALVWIPHHRLCALNVHEAQQSKQIGALNYSRHRTILCSAEDEAFVKLLFVQANVCTFCVV